MTKNPWQGVIRKCYAIGCARCSTEDQLEQRTYDECVRQWRREGWSKTSADGWVCRHCVKREGER
jgi:hypothetical protein